MDTKSRFSNRVENYVKYRPGYPGALVGHLMARTGLSAGGVAADVGCGTGIFARLLIARGVRVYGVEPNREMRQAAERAFVGNVNFTSIDGSAEETGLPAASVELVTAAQAFHWFDVARTRAEFRRILRPGGYVALIWNDRRVDSTPFLADYDTLLRERGTDYERVNHRNVDAQRLREFFGTGEYEVSVFENRQEFDWEGLYGRAMSSSYVPAEETEGYEAFAAGLRKIFDTHAEGGKVFFEYDTRMFLGRLD